MQKAFGVPEDAGTWLPRVMSLESATTQAKVYKFENKNLGVPDSNFLFEYFMLLLRGVSRLF